MALNGCCPTPSSVSGVQASEEQPMAALVGHWFDVIAVTATSTAGLRGCSVGFCMFKEGPRYKDSPAKAGGEGWLVNDQQQ